MHRECYLSRIATIDEWKDYLRHIVATNDKFKPNVACAACRRARERARRRREMADQQTNPLYAAVLELAKTHLETAFDSFKTDVSIPWRELPGNVPKLQHQLWVQALNETLKRHQLEGLLS
jgi:hypothetical protein